jgi:hypothetical protein
MIAAAGPLAIDFDCTVVATPRWLEIVVSMFNRTRVDIGVFDRIPMEMNDGTTVYGPDVTYVELDDETLRVRKMALPIPKGLTMTAYIPPAVTRIAAGSLRRETTRLPLPVKVMQPYRRALLTGQTIADKRATATSVTVEVGVFPIDAGVTLQVDDPAYPDVYVVEPPGPAVARQQILSRSVRLTQPVAVMDYRSVPWP